MLDHKKQRFYTWFIFTHLDTLLSWTAGMILRWGSRQWILWHSTTSFYIMPKELGATDLTVLGNRTVCSVELKQTDGCFCFNNGPYSENMSKRVGLVNITKQFKQVVLFLIELSQVQAEILISGSLCNFVFLWLCFHGNNLGLETGSRHIRVALSQHAWEQHHHPLLWSWPQTCCSSPGSWTDP